MKLSLTSHPLGSLILTLTASAALSLGAAGCFVAAGGTVVVPADTITQVSIDPGAKMSSSPGTGVGVFVQYETGGHWRVATTCDTAQSGASCTFDLIVTARPGVTITGVKGYDLDPSDDLGTGVDGSIELKTSTTLGTNGMTFDTPPGATLSLDAFLEGESAQRFVFAVEGGVLVRGVATNPADFTPSAP